MKTTEKKRRQRGTAVVELAIVLPLLVFLALMICEGSEFLRVHQIINNAAREGARLSSLPENENKTADIVTRVKDYVTANLSADELSTPISVTVDQAAQVTAASGTMVKLSRVTVSYPYSLQFLPGIPFYGGASVVNLNAEADFRNLY